MESNYPEKNHREFKLPNKIKEDYLNSGILSVGEGHGIKEYYEFYEKLIRELPLKPQLAVEMGYLDKRAFEEYLNGKREGFGELSRDGRISFNSFAFLKKMLDEKLITSLIYLDENLNSNSDRDVQMADQFIKNFKKPAVIISGNLHSRPYIVNIWGTTFTPMAYYIKEKLGYFPYIELKVTNGEFFSNGKVQQIKQPEIRDVGKFIETNEGRYEFWLENVSPISPLY